VKWTKKALLDKIAYCQEMIAKAGKQPLTIKNLEKTIIRSQEKIDNGDYADE